MFIAWSLSAASSPSVSPFRLLDNHMLVMTVSLWGFSRILGYWPCNALFFHFFSFINFNLDLNMCFVALAFSKADFVFSVLKLSWHCYFPLGLSSILGYWNGFQVQAPALDITHLCASDSDQALLLLFWMLFLHQSGPYLHLFLGCTAFPHLL